VRIALAKEHRSYSDSISRDIAERKLDFSNVVDKSCYRQHIKGAKGTFLKNQTKLRDGLGEKRFGLTGPAPCGSSWFPWIEKTGIATLRLLSS
jgi:hypothetical protein